MIGRHDSQESLRARFNLISESGLCIGCGLCQSLAGPERIAMAKTPEGNQRPVVTGDLDRELVDKIYAVCPGTVIEGLPEALVDEATQSDPVWGPLRRIVRAWAADPEVRFRGSTGGVLSALATYLLESGRVDFILHATAAKDEPTWGERHISFDKAAVMAGAGSRYGPTAPLLDIGEVLARGRAFAFVGKPCDVAALRSYARFDERVDKLCKLQMVPVCGGFMETGGMAKFLASLGIAEEELTGFSYRGYGCPGPTRVETADGRVIDKNYLDLWGEDESAWKLPFRCKVCPDGIGEAADIAAADTWPGGSPAWEGQKDDPGTNAVVARTAAGLEVLEGAARDGAIVVERDITARDLSDYQPHQVSKKFAVWARHAGLRAAGHLAPETARLRIAELAKEAGFAANLAQARGTRRRAREGLTGEPTPRPTE
ncbi:MAG: Coenzyme F420 hydrogenase/dehydrogenase, beta subunit C-terminal domain [Pseudomonadota bacterium]